ncbi:uncharacterized protein LOC110263542 [Arachis ipaensis]|uniref:uncharacterized protein LOC110263542 n=1 Tax=Arachis ipaensis TaxID=130454 RepID=UPI000A2B1C09|nr:uncharacterized protein LOC110263542 [Arachis ipaensis]
MCSSVIPPSAIPFTFSLTQPVFAFTESLTQPAFLMDLFEQLLPLSPSCLDLLCGCCHPDSSVTTVNPVFFIPSNSCFWILSWIILVFSLYVHCASRLPTSIDVFLSRTTSQNSIDEDV